MTWLKCDSCGNNIAIKRMTFEPGDVYGQCLFCRTIA